VVKNTSIIKDVWIGSDAYIKGANKLKNLTINSSPEAPSQIGEGCEIVNGIVGYGCRVFYGVKAVRFVMASHSQLKYGARLINSFLGNNSTISCCEVLNSLIFPGHEQHHNNSFLCAALVMGQSNIAAGATIGSNHNSRAADGEFVTGRGFWPGLCVSIKHNSKFSTFTLLAKGDYTYELNIPFPFSLVSNDVSNNQLQIMPAYWFLYNLYALARNAQKLVDRDKRTRKIQTIEYDYLAPDSINEIFTALDLLQKYTALAHYPELNPGFPSEELLLRGKALLADETVDLKSITLRNLQIENSNRSVCISKVREANRVYYKLIRFYGAVQIMSLIRKKGLVSIEELKRALPSVPERNKWINIGGQLFPESSLKSLLDDIRTGAIRGWDEVHERYQELGKNYDTEKLFHAYASLLEIMGTSSNDFSAGHLKSVFEEAIETKEWMVRNIYEARSKDYQNEFRTMVYDNDEEMEQVIGKLDDNVFIAKQREELEELKNEVTSITSSFRL
jgi:hypothetical protein